MRVARVLTYADRAASLPTGQNPRYAGANNIPLVKLGALHLSGRRVEIAFVLAAAAVSPGPARATPSVCTDLAGLIRAGLADGDGQGAPFSQFLALAARSDGHVQVDNSGGADVEAVFTKEQASPALIRAVQQEAVKSDSMEPRVFWFGRSGLGMVQSAGTSPECLPYVVFFKTADGKAEAVRAPDVSMQGDACTTMTIWATSIGTTPVLVVQDDKVGASREHLTLVPWENGVWRQACGLTLTYTMIFRGTGKFCRADVNCAEMEPVARVVASRFKADIENGLDFLADGSAADVPGALLKLASQNKNLGEMPTFSRDEDTLSADSNGPPVPADLNAPATAAGAPNVVRLATGFALTEHGYTGGVPPQRDPKNEIQMELMPGTVYLHHYLYPVRLSRQLATDGMALAVIGPSRSINSPIGGLLISIWVRSGSGLAPVASFQNVAVRAKVALVTLDSAL